MLCIGEMEYIVFVFVMAAFVLVIFIQGIINERNDIKYYKTKLRNSAGKLPDKEYKIERFVRIPGYYRKHEQEFQIDDITWNDLGMDDVFVRMNYAISSTGEEYLYYMLRTPQFEEAKLKHFDGLVDYYMSHEDERIEYQWLMKKLGSTGKYSLYDYMDYLKNLGNRSNAKDYISLGIFAMLVMVCFFQLTTGIMGILLWMLYQMINYFKIKKDIEPYITSLAYMMRLLDVADKSVRMLPEVCAEEKEAIEQAKKVLIKSRRGSFIVFNSVESGKTGSMIDGILDYLRMTFHFDLICFNKMLGELVRHMDCVDLLISRLGYLEAAICVGLYRASLAEGWCKPEFIQDGMMVEEGYHPLIKQPVKNSITAKKGVLLTGSNASGKSTFLKMMALNALQAQTIYTVTADNYQAPFYYLYSSMSLRDDLNNGESYYIVEIKAIKRILDNRKCRNGKILCFVDEVLRGTNTVERISASTQILLSMTGEDIQCFAATHDIELTQLLADVYDNYHFEEEIKNGDVLFNYKLCTGKATTRNAISLLEIMGYQNQIIQNARRQADAFLQEGVWKCP